MARILVLDDDRIFRKTLCMALSARGHDVKPAATGEEALSMASASSFDAAIIDMMMPGMNGFEVLSRLREVRPATACIILTGYGSISDAVTAIKLGGYNYLTKPCSIDEIERVLSGITPADGPEPDCQGMAGSSLAMKEVARFIRRVKDTGLPVLISGESGTGKELVARALHFESIRKEMPFIAVNCASLKAGLLENELFGHVKGAFTGALDSKDGLLRAADNGTLFIDEIGDMELPVQAMLLRFMETGSFRPLGSNREMSVNTRIVAAINKDIEKEVAAGRFRLDFYYRLNVCRVHIPPLRERPEDIPALASFFLERASKARGKRFFFGPGALDVLKGHSWPGNVRELKNLMESAAVMSPGEAITEGLLLDSLKQRRSGPLPRPEKGSLEGSERDCIAGVLEANGWNVSRSARVLRIDRRTLQRKMTKYGLKQGGPA
ncbi:MAG: sigma-54-dependent Fis family transcriptional regulator [Deltaproteobacteria bacterium]|nr:sigma-54-dependent Fis family transcriptional regulator [Deltaproteobacteria bacterium]MBZ0220179.1 sigma-54 dependent transcriptional regulator [Deltaproteobacteria bacterium]